MEFVALIEDGHAKVEGGLEYLSGYYPIGFNFLHDGIFCVKAMKGRENLIGLKLVAIDGHPIAQVIDSLSQMVSFDNEQTIKNRVTGFLNIPEVLEAYQLINDKNSINYEFLVRDGKEQVAEITKVDFSDNIDWAEKKYNIKYPFRFELAKHYYNDTLIANKNILYIDFNKVQNDKSFIPIDEYFQNISTKYQSNTIDKLLIDLRFNGGGNDYYNHFVIEFLEKEIKKNPQLDIYLGIGKNTYSAAQKLISRIQNNFEPILIGENTGSSPNHFGDAVKIHLTNSNLNLKVSTIYHEDQPKNKSRSSMPEIKIPLTSIDFFNSSDPILSYLMFD
mgnify:CR=1 FL=1